MIRSFELIRSLESLCASKKFIEAGGSLAYGVSYPDQCRRAAIYIENILPGARPADLPVKQPTKFELVIISRPLKPRARDPGVGHCSR
jgi:putative ABC transport system substrate-binding protein